MTGSTGSFGRAGFAEEATNAGEGVDRGAFGSGERGELILAGGSGLGGTGSGSIGMLSGFCGGVEAAATVTGAGGEGVPVD